MKPREKLINYGARTLLNEELIAILLRTGSAQVGVLELAKKVYAQLNGIEDIKNITVDDLRSIHGISDAKATTIIAAVELGRRMDTKNIPKKYMIQESSDVYHLLKEDLSHLPKEHLIVLCVDIKGQLLKKETIYIGTTSSIQVAVKDVFKSAVRIGCFGIIVVHNHPSGDAKPSVSDLDLTRQMEAAGKVLTIELIDHIIIGRNEFYSYRKQKMHKL